jgi:hypothetical protein
MPVSWVSDDPKDFQGQPRRVVAKAADPACEFGHDTASAPWPAPDQVGGFFMRCEWPSVLNKMGLVLSTAATPASLQS